MAFLPFWPKTATTLYNLLAFSGFWSLVAVGMATVGGSTAKWVNVWYDTPRDGTSYSRGLWRECTFAAIPGQEQCNHISPSEAYSWERACQAFFFLFIFTEFTAAILFFAAMRRASSRAGRNPSAKAAGAVSMFAAWCGLIAMAIFVNKEPVADRGRYVRHLHWSFGLFTAAWALAAVIAPLGWAA